MHDDEAAILDYDPIGLDFNLRFDGQALHMCDVGHMVDTFKDKINVINDVFVYIDNYVLPADRTRRIEKHLVRAEVIKYILPLQKTYILHVPKYRLFNFLFARQTNGVCYWYALNSHFNTNGTLDEVYTNNPPLGRIIAMKEVHGS